MDAVTYPTQDVVDFVSNYLTPLQINVKEDPPNDKYHYYWTPTLAILNFDGVEIQRTIGFFGPEEFIPRMHLGIAKVRFDAGDFDTALVHLRSILKSFPDSTAVPEAIYFQGVALYKQNNTPGTLKEAYEKLQADYPESAWSKRAYPYRLI